MSKIKAGTTSTTAYQVEADTTGALVFQTGASPTTAMTLSSAQVVTFANPPTATGGGSVATNTAYGTSALVANTSGIYNAAFGDSSLSTNQTGGGNSAFGHEALKVMLNVNNNSAFGSQALTANTSGAGNTGLGSNALVANTTGSNNVAVGLQALNANTTASGNTAVGYQAGYSNTGTPATQDGSIFIGYQAGFSQTTPAFPNLYIGKSAGYANITGQRNTYVGVTTAITATGSGNTVFGYSAGASLTTGSNNTFIGGRGTGSGDGAGWAITTGSNNTIVGQFGGLGGGLDIRTASNYIVLSDGDGNPTLISTGIGSISANHTSAGGNSEFCLMRASVKKWFIWNDGTTDRFNITPSSFSSGVYLTNTATAWAAYSDRRIKSNIVDLEYGLATVMAMQPRRYTVTANSENSIGFVAQELKEVLPEAVVGEEIEFSDDDTPQERSAKTMGVAKDNIIPVLVKAIQEQQAIIEQLRADVETLKGAA